MGWGRVERGEAWGVPGQCVVGWCHLPEVLLPLTGDCFRRRASAGAAPTLWRWIVALSVSCFYTPRARRPGGPTIPVSIDGNICKKRGQHTSLSHYDHTVARSGAGGVA